MFKVLNVSDRSLQIGGYKIAPLEFHIFNENEINENVKAKINSLASLGLVKVLAVEIQSEPVKAETTKKSTKKSK